MRVDYAAPPHTGRRLTDAYTEAMTELNDSELERYAVLLDLAEDDPYRAEVTAKARDLADNAAPGAAAWDDQITATADTWPESGDAPREEWARVRLPAPPTVPGIAAREQLAAARTCEAGADRDAHIVAAVALSLMWRLGHAGQWNSGKAPTPAHR